MKKFFIKFNFIFLLLSIILLLGIVWIWRNTLSADYSITTSQSTMNNQQIINNSDKEINLFNNEVEELENLKIIKEEDFLITTSSIQITENLAQNDEKVLPKEFLLKVPFTSQAPEKNWEQPWQDACEEAALLMLDAYYKNYNLSPLFSRDEILKIVKWEEEQEWGTSIEIEKIKKLAEEYFGLNKKNNEESRKFIILENPTVEDIKKSLVAGNPVLVVADGKVLPNPHFRNSGPVYHALIIKGYTETEFITNDPGTQFGESFKYKYNDLLKAVHDWNKGKVKEGKKVILFIE
ncbi:MAG TPA: C39 family peptidase [Candidatus Magasanikbacteria bacterium]|jgi:hypothetical protein|nr:C39 family peptidase [Candidatus Magasanikbacteria bacterium]